MGYNIGISPKVSILMPAKNAGKFLPDCLNSILQQTESNWELIVINDHSTDHTFDVLQAFANKDQRIQVFNNQGKGIIAALRLAFAKSEGQLITRMDADDLMLAEKLIALKKILIANGEGYLATGAVEYFSEDQLGDGYQKYAAWLNRLNTNNQHFQEIYKECVVPSPCWMLWRSDLEACRAFETDIYPEDYDLCFRFYEKGLKTIGHKEVIHRWRDYATRTSRTDEHYADNRFLDLKLHYFLKLDYRASADLVLWGAGKKGKALAQQLIEKQVPFYWVCNNKNKIGKNIYGQTMQGTNLLNNLATPQIIIAVAGDKTQASIIAQLEKLQKGKDWFLFC